MLTEKAFLDAQSTAAKARLGGEAKALATELLAPLHLQPLVRRHPFWSLGGATLAGFLAAGGLTRKSEAAATAATTTGLPASLAAFVQRIRRLVTSAIGAGLLANLRAHATARASTNDADESAEENAAPPTAAQ